MTTQKTFLLLMATIITLLACPGSPPVRPPKSPQKGPIKKGQIESTNISPLGITAVPLSSRPAEIRAFLLKVHRVVEDPWNVVRAKAKVWLPKNDPANDPRLVAVVDLPIDSKGQPGPPRIHRRSGHSPFDLSALEVMEKVRELPPLPNAGEGRLVLRWTFFRNKLSASPEYASLRVVPFTSKREALRHALDLRRWSQAKQILHQHPDDPELFAVLAEAGMTAKDPALRELSLGLATSGRIRAFLSSEGGNKRRYWAAALTTLCTRRDSPAIVALLQQVLAGPGAPRRGARNRNSRTWRLLQLCETIQRTQNAGMIPEPLLVDLLTDPQADVVRAALPLVRSPGPLLKARQRLKTRPRLFCVLAVRRLSLGHDPQASKLARWCLNSPHREEALEALARFPVPALVGQVEALVKSQKAPTSVRIKAIEVMAGQPSSVTVTMKPVLIALRAKDPGVQRAAARALGQPHRWLRNRKGIAFRLADLSHRKNNRGPVAAEALVSLAKLGSRHFWRDLTWRSAKLKPKHQARVISELWRFGAAAVPILKKKLASPQEIIRRAASSSLARISGSKTRARAADLQAAAQERPEEPLADLLRWAIGRRVGKPPKKPGPAPEPKPPPASRAPPAENSKAPGSTSASSSSSSGRQSPPKASTLMEPTKMAAARPPRPTEPDLPLKLTLDLLPPKPNRFGPPD
jgi:TonB family protein